jgi:hypothetical protein
MEKLKIFVNAQITNAAGPRNVYYSRCGGGPYYRWSYETEPGKWRSFRLNPNDFVLRNLCVSTWNSVPDSLQAKLSAHYLQ